MRCTIWIFVIALALPTHAAEPPPVHSAIDRLVGQLVQPLGAGEEADWKQVAVLPFEANDAGVADLKLGRISSELLSARLAHQAGVLLVERARIDHVIGEIKRQESGALAPGGAASVGRLLGASSVVLGNVASAGKHYLITARLVDTRTGRILTAADQSLPQAGMVALSEDVVEVRSRFGAAARSLAGPGWGQIYNGDTGRGVTYLSLVTGLAAGAVVSGVLGADAEDSYLANTAASVGHRAEADSHYQRTNAFLIGMGAVWLMSVLDAYVTGQDMINIDLGADVFADPTAVGRSK